MEAASKENWKQKHWLVLFIAQEYIANVGGKEGASNQNTLNFHFCFQKWF